MAVNLTNLTASVNNIQALDDNPNESGLTSNELKAKFDKAGSDIKDYINNTLIDELETILDGYSSSISDQQTAINTVTTTANTNASNIGQLASLNTSVKTNLVSAINEVNTHLSTSNVLWSGGYYMGSAQTANLNQSVTSQKNGIVLCWSAYANGQSQNYNWNFIFIPKQFITTAGEGNGVSSFLVGSSLDAIGYKYVYVNDNTITGHDFNDDSGSKSGITYNNRLYVLRYVIGV